VTDASLWGAAPLGDGAVFRAFDKRRRRTTLVVMGVDWGAVDAASSAYLLGREPSGLRVAVVTSDGRLVLGLVSGERTSVVSAYRVARVYWPGASASGYAHGVLRVREADQAFVLPPVVTDLELADVWTDPQRHLMAWRIASSSTSLSPAGFAPDEQ